MKCHHKLHTDIGIDVDIGCAGDQREHGVSDGPRTPSNSLTDRQHGTHALPQPPASTTPPTSSAHRHALRPIVGGAGDRPGLLRAVLLRARAAVRSTLLRRLHVRVRRLLLRLDAAML